MIQTLKNRLPNRAIDIIKLLVYQSTLPFNALYDFARYARYSASSLFWRDSNKLKGMLIKDYHRLEKGMALPEPRRGFGQKVAERLIGNMKTSIQRYGPDATVALCLSVLEAYVAFQVEQGVELDAITADLHILSRLLAEHRDKANTGGLLHITRRQLRKSADIDFEAFSSSRYSVRQFTGNPVPDETIAAAIKAAQKTPSVCNRQAWRTHLYHDAERCRQILRLQNGNKGFGDRASHIAVITVDLKYFEGPGERSQAFVDGGLYAMSLVYALHAAGVGSCFLNWSQPMLQDMKMHKIGEIPSNEIIITFLAIGEMPEELSVARSCRRDIDEIVTWHS